MDFTINYDFTIPTRVHSGYGILDRMDSIVSGKKLGRNILLVTGKTAMKKLGVTARLTDLLKKAGRNVVLYDAVEPNPTNHRVDDGVRLAVSERCDAVMGLGGGSPIDAAKGIAVAAGNGGEIWDYAEPGADTSKTLPIIAVPTTSGTGTDCDRYFVLTNPEKKSKIGFAFDEAYPAVSILDPKLTETMPRQTTLDTAMDIMGHCYESYISRMRNPFGEIIGLNGIRLVYDYLPKVLENERDAEARSALMLAAAFGGIAIDRGGVCSPHGIAMKLGGLYNITHGQGVGIILPYALENARPHIDDKLDFMARFFGEDRGSREKNAEAMVRKLFDFVESIGFKTKLSEVGVTEEMIPEVMQRCVDDDDIENDPADFTGNIESFFRKML